MSEGISNNHLPPKIVELLKKKGWTWPPSEEQKRHMAQARREFVGSASGSLRVLKEIRAEMPGRLPEIADED